MRSLLYLGNMSSKKASITVMEAHIALLAPYFTIYAASSRKHKLLRMLDMIALFLRRQRHADYVLISVYSTLNFYYAWVLALLCRVFKKPYIAYLHGGNLPARLLHSPGMSKAIFAHSHANVAPSGYLQDAFERAGFQCISIPNFIEVGNYPFLHRTQLRPNVLWVRSLKNHTILK